MNLRNFKSVKDRREALENMTGIKLSHIGKFTLDEQIAATKNCENMIGATQVPLGVAGPLAVKGLGERGKGKEYYLPLATTEGALVASVNRGCKAITESGGCVVNSQRIGATRGPVFQTTGIAQNQKFYEWIKSHEQELAKVAESTSSHLHYKKAKVTTVGQYAYVRFVFGTQDAMGMNMVTIATQKMTELIAEKTKVKCLSVSGNFCVDKKVSWQNFLNHRGIEAWAEVVLPAAILKNTLKTTAEQVFRVWLAKCMLGSAMSGSIGFNAQAANVIAALFLATGQDPAHVGEGSMAVTTTEVIASGEGKALSAGRQGEKGRSAEDLYVSVYLPDLMVGTVGGGTGLATQQEALRLLGIAGGNKGNNSQQLAETIAAAVLAGEISLLSSLEEGSLAQTHERLARGR